ncbi:hypothetical protein NBRC116590_02650 [Pelagimonas sp. KU-00592-HH]|uniref:peptidase P60 n=1 Tax=Pelagimonas sp. KU-00592-HH TaxID=3127651 RepID=UPI0031062895
MDHVSKAEIVREAREWIGTPFLHQQSVQGGGCDCVGLIRGLWRAIIGPEPEAPPPYPSRVDLLEASILTEFADRYLQPISADEAGPGDVLVMRFKEDTPTHHAVILVEAGRCVHAWGGRTVRKVVEGPLPPRAEITGAYSFPGAI